ncbi:GFA family protein [Aspergillus glaucus CBS 516.65]|uniref:CENP-V/GFA domain-containing protein n=1 Tax=Aspergillus glaucus CBS 516.65 TaxID=1160497 RepID=A0A1L9VAQ3_ASPGL|nr:hypothetical protein ASPGLDRAFT_133666 [Aspergillus glaucus CBS 516.65]OJJ81011.1 hypothetical protein ASPGLDRAFT_133666 [Aspergillus glaucus CBS 516.65]
MTTGSCSCNHIRYTTTHPPTKLVNCHCTTCRKQSGAPYQTWAHFNVSQVTWLTSPPTTRSSSTIATRGFCPKCGSSLTMAYKSMPELIGIPAGTIDPGSDGEDIPRPDCHIFLSEKAGWFEVPGDGLERFEGHFMG